MLHSVCERRSCLLPCKCWQDLMQAQLVRVMLFGGSSPLLCTLAASSLVKMQLLSEEKIFARVGAFSKFSWTASSVGTVLWVKYYSLPCACIKWSDTLWYVFWIRHPAWNLGPFESVQQYLLMKNHKETQWCLKITYCSSMDCSVQYSVAPLNISKT